MNNTMRHLKNGLRQMAYAVGLQGWIHRIRNRRTLTVFMFHRVLPKKSLAYKHSEKEFTFSIEGFAATLDFIQKHYNVIDHYRMRQYVVSNVPLPDRAGLITFDDGWLDTLTYAVPELRKRKLPSVLFLATEVLDQPADLWWQDRLIDALATSGNLERLEAAVGLRLHESESYRRRRLIARVALLPDAERHELLDGVISSPPLGRQMVKATDLSAFTPDVSVSGHGHTHAPLTHVENGFNELRTSHDRLKALKQDDWAMSFPHGDYTPEMVELAHAAGFDILYTSDACMVDTSRPIRAKKLIGRIHMPENKWTCIDDGIAAEKLATFLFYRPISR